MWDSGQLGDFCSGCKVRITNDRAARKISCAECGLDFGLTATTEPMNTSSGDILTSDLGNYQSRSSDPVSITTTEPMNASSGVLLTSDDDSLQNRGSDPLAVATTEPINTSSNDFLTSDIRNSESRGSDLVSIATTEPMNASSADLLTSDADNLQNRGSDPVSLATIEPMTASSDDLLTSDADNLQNRGSDPVSLATTEPMKASDDDLLTTDADKLQNRSFDPLAIATTEPNNASSDDAIIASTSDRLGLLDTVKNQATEINEKVKDQCSRMSRNARLAACIYIACQQNDMALSIKEISRVPDGAPVLRIVRAVKSIAKKLGIPSAELMDIQAAKLAKQFSSTLQMDSQAVKAAEEAAGSYTGLVTRGSSPLSFAAVVVYIIARVSYEKKLIKDIIEATGVEENTIKETYKDLYPYLSMITPKWFANAKDLKKLGEP